MELQSALVLFSGGQDSTTCLAWALDRFDRVELACGEREVVEGAHRLFDVRDSARADQRRGDDLVAQRPGDRQLRERLTARLRDLVELLDLLDLRRREPSGMPLRYLLDSKPCARGENTMQPMRCLSSSAMRPSSIQRLNML